MVFSTQAHMMLVVLAFAILHERLSDASIVRIRIDMVTMC